MTAISNGGAAQRVKVLTDADLKANGGAYALEGRPPVAVYGVVDAETTAQGGDYVVMGNVAQPVYVVDPPDGVGEATIAPIPMIAVDGTLAMGSVAIPVYVVGGSLGGLDPVENLELTITGAAFDVITATWDAVPTATDYEVEYSPDGVTYTPVGTTALLTFDIEDTDYDVDVVTHYIRVRAVGGEDWAVATISGLLINLVAYWTLNEVSGTRFDSVGSNNLTDNNTVGSGVGKIGNAADFIAANDEYLELASSPYIEFGDSNFTISAWFNPNSLGSYFMVTKDNDPDGRDFQLAMFGAQLHWELFPSQVLNVNDIVQASTWQHAVAYHNATDDIQGLAYNGADNTRSTTAPLSAASTQPLRISSRASGALYMDGLIDETGIWQRTLSTAQIAALYNGGSGLTYPFAP